MSLKIENLVKDGDESNEYILLMATEDLDIGYYAIVDCTFKSTGQISNVHKHFYRFPFKNVKKGEYISLRTGKGTDTVGEIEGTPVHRFFWGSNAPFWNDSQTEKAEVLKVETIGFRTV